jgi:hypothetical protein
VWARGNSAGWGQNGELEFYIKIGRDQNNFYLYRTPVNSGRGRATWLPEVRVDFRKLFDLREQLQNNFLQASADTLSCTGIDSVLIARSGIPLGQPVNRHAVCADGYIVYSIDPAINPPNLAAVQELAVGMVRVATGTGGTPIIMSDTLELWVDDIRLTDVDRTPGYAGQIAMSVSAGDIATLRLSASRVDGNFRQLAELPSFVGNDALTIGTTVRLERLVPGASALSMPLVINHSSSASDPLFVAQSDIRGAGIDGLRTPRRSVTNYSLGIRRAVPLRGSGVLPTLVNNLSANASYGSSTNRSEFANGGTRLWNATVDYSLQAQSRLAGLPAWLTGILPSWRALEGLREGRVRWTPTQLRFSSTLGRTEDSRTSFLRPAATATDSGRLVRGLTAVWRTQSAIEFRPTTGISARWDFSSVRDLRNYGDTSATAIVATGERERLLGADIGLERERQMNANITYAPAITVWLRPRVTLASAYSMQRDPQSRQLVRTADSTGAFRLPRRLSSAQTISAATMFDPGRALVLWRGEGGWVERWTAIIRPFDLSYTRALNSVFDGAPFTPGAAYQLSLGGIDQFRAVDDRAATAAGFTEQVALSSALELPTSPETPYSLALNTRLLRGSTRNFVRRLDNTQGVVDGAQSTVPDLSLRGSLTPPGLLRRVVGSINSTIGYRHTRQNTIDRGLDVAAEPDARTSRVWDYPINGSITWAFLGDLRTGGGYAKQRRVDSLPGSVTESLTEEITADLQRFIRLPASFGLRSEVNTRVNWSKQLASTYVGVRGDPSRSRLADNGRSALSVSADTEIASNMSFSLQVSNVVTFDNNYNRKFSQLVITTVFSLQYFANSSAR